MAYNALAPAGIFFGVGGGSEVHQGRACKRGRRVGGSGGGAEPPDAGEVFKNFVKKQRKFLQFFKKFSRKFRYFFKIF